MRRQTRVLTRGNMKTEPPLRLGECCFASRTDRNRGVFYRIALTVLSLVIATASAQTNAPTQTAAPSPTAAPTPAAATANAAPTQSAAGAQNAEAGVPPPAAPAKRSNADLEKLVAPIALYPDPLIASVLPASAYPLEIVQAARFVKDTNNIAKIDSQPWDDNVKAVARLPDVISQMDLNIGWTSDLGDAFINQPKEVMDAIQSMRAKAEDSGALKTTPQQVVTVTNTVVTNTVEQQTVYVTNQIVQIQPAQPEVIYVPQYNPTVVYGSYPASYPGYYYPSAGDVAAASVVSFGVGMAVGAIVANNCDWGHGGVYWGGGWHHGDVDIDVDRDVNVERNVNQNINQNVNRNVQNRTGQAQGQKWQPDQNRLKNSGSTLSSAQSREARGWSSGQAGATASQAGTGAASARAQQARTSASQARASGTTAGTRPSTGTTATRPSTTAGTRPSTTQGATRPSGARPSTTESGGRISSSAGANRPEGTTRPSTTTGATRPSTTGATRPSTTSGAARSSSTTPRPTRSATPSTTSRSYSGSGGSSAFSGVSSGSADRAASQRGSMSRSGGGGSAGAARSGGGGARGGGGGRRR